MQIIAHSGAQNYPKNSRPYLEAIRNGRIRADAFEVNVRCRKGYLYMSKYPSLFYKRCLPLETALLLAKEKKTTIVLNLRQFGILPSVQDTVLALGLENQVIYTGNFSQEEVEVLTSGTAYADIRVFFPNLDPVSDIAQLASEFECTGNPRIRGVYADYKKVPPEFFTAAAKIKLPVAVASVNDKIALQRVLPYQFDVVLTTNPNYIQKMTEEKKQ